jgi:DNA-binding MurR/RpiR family transcriptional regulator
MPRKPQSLESLRALIHSEADRLTPRELDAARYALDHPNDIALNSVAAVADLSGIAAAAFVRMAKALGLKGYTELQKLLREPLQRIAAPTFSERIRHFGGELAIEHPEDPVAILQAFSQANIVSLTHLQDSAAQLPLARAIRLIQTARVVHVLGLRRSFAVASYLAYALNRVGRPAVQITGMGGTIAEQVGAVGAQDLLIAISFPPYAGDTLRMWEQARAQGAKRLAISNSVLSPLAKDADLVLEVNDAELKGFRSLTSAMCLAQTLAMGLAFDKPHKRAGRKAAAPRDLGDIDC